MPPECDPGHVYHLFPVLAGDRDAFQAHLAAQGIGTLVHYPIPIPRQPAFARYSPAACPIADRVCAEVCSLPLHPQLPDADVDVVAAAVLAYRGGPRIAGVRRAMIRAGLAALLVAYLPGALLFRLPVANRARRAALAAEERVFWHVILSVAWSLAVVLALASLGAYRFERLLVANAILSGAVVLAGRGAADLARRGASRSGGRSCCRSRSS